MRDLVRRLFGYSNDYDPTDEASVDRAKDMVDAAGLVSSYADHLAGIGAQPPSTPNPFIMVQGKRIMLDFIDNRIWNQNRLPKWILFRAPFWGEGNNRHPGDFYVELLAPGGIGPTIDMKWLASEQARSHQHHHWVLVELCWMDGEPHEVQLIEEYVYDENGNSVSNYDRAKAARLAAKALKESN